MKELFLGFINRLPVCREIHGIYQEMLYNRRHHRVMAATSVIQAIEALKAGNERYRDPKRLLVHGAQHWSQNYEDGMIAEIFRRVGMTTRTFLEIGVGNGSHAQLLATYAKDFTGIDLTDYGVNSTSRRIEIFGLNNARILQMNAEELKFENNSFDLIWSWGVVHHSANPRRILKEIHRVLKPGGVFKAMVYYRSFWSYYAFAILTGVFKGYFFKGDSLHEAAQKITDGAIARSYSREEWRQELGGAGLKCEDIRILGLKSAILPIPGSRLKYAILEMVPNRISRFMTNNLRMGSFIFSTARKQ